MKYLRRSVPVFVLAFSCIAVSAQQNHFIYLQTENRQPFYVKMGKTIYNSTISGYLIIPKLKEGNYDFSVGFVNSNYGEQKFTSTVARQDVGYVIKRLGEKGWSLFNLQTLQVAMAGTSEQHLDISKNTTLKTDDFSQMLSTVVNDPSIKYEQKESLPEKRVINDTIAAKALPPLELIKPNPDSDIKNIHNIDSGSSGNQTPSTTVVLKKFTIVKSMEVEGKEGLNLVYIDSGETGKKDTISILIPLAEGINADTVKTIAVSLTSPTVGEKNELKQNESFDKTSKEQISKGKNETLNEVSNTKETLDNSNKNTTPEKKTEEKSKDFLSSDIHLNEPVKKDSFQDQEKANNASVTGLIVSNNTTCTGYGNESDFFKLRKKMAAADSEDDMVSVAKKAFKSKCYSTEQVKNLGSLFLSDVGKYNFFDAAYPHVYDSNNFSQLQNQLVDEYYKNRFKAMLRQ